MLVFRSRFFAKARNADLAEITALNYSGERLVVCRNPPLASERDRKTRACSDRCHGDKQAAARRDKIGLGVGQALGWRKMAKHFQLTVEDAVSNFGRDAASIACEVALDGFYVLRTNVAKAELGSAATALAYTNPAQAERAFRTIEITALEVRLIHHRLAGRVRAHVFLCMLANYVIWHMRQLWRRCQTAVPPRPHASRPWRPQRCLSQRRKRLPFSITLNVKPVRRVAWTRPRAAGWRHTLGRPHSRPWNHFVVLDYVARIAMRERVDRAIGQSHSDAAAAALALGVRRGQAQVAFAGIEVLDADGTSAAWRSAPAKPTSSSAIAKAGELGFNRRQDLA
jgi:hypothetical protein